MRKRAGDHLQGKSLGFTLRLYFIFKCVHPHADITTKANSATRKLLWRMERVETGLRSYWTPVQPRESGRTTLVGTRKPPASGTPSMAQNLGRDSYWDKVVLIHWVKYLRGWWTFKENSVLSWAKWHAGIQFCEDRTATFSQEQLQGNSFHWTKPHPEETSWHFRHNSKQLSSFKVRICYFLSFSNSCLLKCLVGSLTSI